MSRRRVAVALALVLLAATAPLAAVANSHSQLAVGSIQTTDSDFNSAASLTNISVSDGTASLTASTDTIESFESGNLNDYGGDTGAFSVTSAESTDGPNSLTTDASSRSYISDTDVTISQGSTWSVDFYSSGTDGFPGHVFATQSESGVSGISGYEVRIEHGHGEIALQRHDSGSPTQIDSQSASLPTGEWLTADIQWSNDGTITATVFDEAGSEIAEVSAQDNTYTSGGIGWGNSSPNGQLDWYFDFVRYNQHSTQASYVGATHTVEQAEQAFVNLTLVDAHADYRIEYGGGPWQVAASGTLSTTGNHTIDISGHPDETQWRTNVTLVNETTAATTADINDEGIQFTARSPSISNLSPSGSADLSDDQVTLEAQINDSDFGLAQSDSLTATWYMNGSQIDQHAVSSNGTYSTTATGLSGGSHTWNVTVTDDYGLTSESGERTISTPDTLFIYYEDNPSQLVTKSGTVEVSLYGEDDTVITRTTDDGTVDLTGLDPSQEHPVSADVSGTHPRRTVITSLYEQQEIYLLNETETTVDVTYTLDDQTGEFPASETRLLLQRPITKDFDGDAQDETRYQTILGDTFGAVNEFPATVVPNQRYQIVVENEDGDRRELGTHTVSSSGTQTITIGEISVGGDTEADTAFSAGMIQNGSRYIRLSYVDQQDATSTFIYNVTREDGSTFLSNQTVSGEFGTYQNTIAVPASEPEDQTYYVNFWGERTGEPDVSGQRVVGGVPAIASNLGVDPVLLQYGSWVLIVASMGFTVIFDDRLAAVTGVALGTALTWLGFVTIPAVGLGIAGAIAVMYVVAREGTNR